MKGEGIRWVLIGIGFGWRAWLQRRLDSRFRGNDGVRSVGFSAMRGATAAMARRPVVDRRRRSGRRGRLFNVAAPVPLAPYLYPLSLVGRERCDSDHGSISTWAASGLAMRLAATGARRPVPARRRGRSRGWRRSYDGTRLDLPAVYLYPFALAGRRVWGSHHLLLSGVFMLALVQKFDDCHFGSRHDHLGSFRLRDWVVP